MLKNSTPVGLSDFPEGETIKDIPLDRGVVGILIGSKGQNIARLRTETMTHIQLNQSVNPPVVVVSGHAQNVEHAERLIRQITDNPENLERGRNYLPSDTDETALIEVPITLVGLFIGKNGENIKEMCRKTKCRMQVDHDAPCTDPTKKIFSISGPEGCVKECIAECFEWLRGQCSVVKMPGQCSLKQQGQLRTILSTYHEYIAMASGLQNRNIALAYAHQTNAFTKYEKLKEALFAAHEAVQPTQAIESDLHQAHNEYQAAQVALQQLSVNPDTEVSLGLESCQPSEQKSTMMLQQQIQQAEQEKQAQLVQQQAHLVQQVQAFQQTQSQQAQTFQQAQEGQQAKIIQMIQAAQQAQASQAMQQDQASQAMQQAQASQAMQQVQASQAMQQAQLAQAMQHAQASQAAQLAQVAQQTQVTQQAQTIQQLQLAVQQAQAAQVAQQAQVAAQTNPHTQAAAQAIQAQLAAQQAVANPSGAQSTTGDASTAQNAAIVKFLAQAQEASQPALTRSVPPAPTAPVQSHAQVQAQISQFTPEQLKLMYEQYKAIQKR